MNAGGVIGLIKAVGGSGGGGGGALVVNVSVQTPNDAKGPVATTLVCDKTAAEMYSAAQSGSLVFHYETMEGEEVGVYVYRLAFYAHNAVYAFGAEESMVFTAVSGTDYPTASAN